MNIYEEKPKNDFAEDVSCNRSDEILAASLVIGFAIGIAGGNIGLGIALGIVIGLALTNNDNVSCSIPFLTKNKRKNDDNY